MDQKYFGKTCKNYHRKKKRIWFAEFLFKLMSKLSLWSNSGWWRHWLECHKSWGSNCSSQTKTPFPRSPLTEVGLMSFLVLMQNFNGSFLENQSVLFSSSWKWDWEHKLFIWREKKIYFLQLLETVRNESFLREIKGNDCIFDIHNSFPRSAFQCGVNQLW